MANALYDKGREKFLAGQIAWGTGTGGDTIKAVLVDTAAYTVDLANHEFLSSIPAGDRIATSPAFTAKATTAGVADAADLVFAAVVGDPCEAMVIIKDTGNASTSPLIAYIDSATGLPVIPNGGDITVSFAATGIFKL